jgi:glycerol-3-phosphate acyltransferase
VETSRHVAVYLKWGGVDRVRPYIQWHRIFTSNYVEEVAEMVSPTILPKVAAQWLLTFYRAAWKLRRHAFHVYNRNAAAAAAGVSSKSALPADAAVVCATHGALLRSTDLFPYFMLVAFEGGSLLRALLLLAAFPLVWALGRHRAAGIRVMAFVAFAGLRPRDVDLVARAVLPKHYMESLDAVVYDRLWLPAKRRVVVTSAPRVMAEWFLKEYLAADAVIGCELQVVAVGRHGRRYFTGLLSGPAPGPELRNKDLREAFGGAMADVGVVQSSNPLDHLFIPYCKVRVATFFVVCHGMGWDGTRPLISFLRGGPH